MSGSSASGNPSTSKATVSDASKTPSTLQQQAAASKQAVQLEEDDEFEDFPVEDWQDEDTDPSAAGTTATGAGGHLWEESWDDDDTSEDFAQMLREELKKSEGKR